MTANGTELRFDRRPTNWRASGVGGADGGWVGVVATGVTFVTDGKIRATTGATGSSSKRGTAALTTGGASTRRATGAGDTSGLAGLTGSTLRVGVAVSVVLPAAGFCRSLLISSRNRSMSPAAGRPAGDDDPPPEVDRVLARFSAAAASI